MFFKHESVIEASIEEVFAFHERPDAFALLSPPWEATDHPAAQQLKIGTVVKLRNRVGIVWIDIVAEHVAYEKNQRFEDVMTRGPFAKWHHKHLFLPDPKGCLLRDEIEYQLPLGVLGRLIAPLAVVPRLKRMFRYRHDVTRREVLAAAQRSPVS